MADRVDWQSLLQERDENLEELVSGLNPTESGRAIHSHLESLAQREYPGVSVEESVENGTYDVFDGELVYEIKTKHPAVFDSGPPYDRDVEQVQKYLSSEDMDAEFGILVYVNRGDLSEVDEYAVLN